MSDENESNEHAAKEPQSGECDDDRRWLLCQAPKWIAAAPLMLALFDPQRAEADGDGSF